MAVYNRAEFGHLLVRLLQKFVQHAEFMHQLEGGWMNRVAAEIANEVRVLFQNLYLHAGASEEKAEHQSGGAAADNQATRLGFFGNTHSKLVYRSAPDAEPPRPCGF